MEKKTKICPYCGFPMEEGNFDLYYGQEYECKTASCPRFEMADLRAKYQKLMNERSQISNLQRRIILEKTPIGQKLVNFRNAYIEALNSDAIEYDMREILSLELQNLSKM